MIARAKLHSAIVVCPHMHPICPIGPHAHVAPGTPWDLPGFDF